MYHKEKEEARKLRSVEGLSLKGISKKLGIARSTISLWVRDIVLTEEQLLNLQEKSKGNFLTGSRNSNHNIFKERREKYQEAGRKLVQNCNKNFIAGLMLFWAEGSKKKNNVTLSNGDPEPLKFFVNFLRRNLNVNNDNIILTFQWYSGNGISQEETENFWLNTLELKKENLRKCYIDYRPIKNMGKKIGKCPYGIGRVQVSSTEIAQKLYGAIQEYVGFDNPKWLY